MRPNAIVVISLGCASLGCGHARRSSTGGDDAHGSSTGASARESASRDRTSTAGTFVGNDMTQLAVPYSDAGIALENASVRLEEHGADGLVITLLDADAGGGCSLRATGQHGEGAVVPDQNCSTRTREGTMVAHIHSGTFTVNGRVLVLDLAGRVTLTPPGSDAASPRSLQLTYHFAGVRP